MITIASQYHPEIRYESLPMCFLFFKIVLAILVSLHFHINLGSASISTKKKMLPEILLRIALH